MKKSTKKKQSVDNIPSDGGIIIVEDDIVFDRAQDNEMRKAYLEEHRSQSIRINIDSFIQAYLLHNS